MIEYTETKTGKKIHKVKHKDNGEFVTYCGIRLSKLIPSPSFPVYPRPYISRYLTSNYCKTCDRALAAKICPIMEKMSRFMENHPDFFKEVDG